MSVTDRRRAAVWLLLGWLAALSATPAAAAPAPAAAAAPADIPAVIRAFNQGLRRFDLGNGVIGLVKRDPSAPVVSVQVWVGTGSIRERNYLGSGLCHAIEHMIFKGTQRRGVGEISREIHDAGGQINAYTSYDRTVFHTDLPSSAWRTGVDVLADALMHASFPAEEWTREREVIRREIAMGRDDPPRQLTYLLMETAYRQHPCRFPVIGHEAQFVRITREDLVAFFRESYVTDNLLVVLVGDVPEAEAEAELRRAFGAMERRTRPTVVLPAEPEQTGRREARKTGDYNLTRLDMAFHTVGISHPDSPALDLLAQVAGGGRSSPLYRVLREERRLVHEVSAWAFNTQEPGLFGVEAVCDPDKEGEVVAAIESIVAGWRENLFPDEEIEKARRMMLVRELESLQTMQGQADSYGSGEFYTGHARYAEVYVDILSRLTAADLRAVARRYLQPRNLTVALLSPPPAAAADPAGPAAVVAPAVSRRELPGGATLLVREDHRLPFVYMCAALRGGLLAEAPDQLGVNLMMAQLLVRGCGELDNAAVAALVDRHGAVLSPFSGQNSFGIRVRCLAEDVPQFARLLGDCLRSPRFAAGELEKQREAQLAVLAAEEEKPMYLAQKALTRALFGAHPYHAIPEGSAATVRTITRDQVAAQYRRLCGANNLVLAMFGDITAAGAAALAQDALTGMPAVHPDAWTPASPPPPAAQRIVQTAPRAQAIVLAGFPGVTLTDPRRDALEVLQTAMSGLSSELGMEVREKRGLVYYVGAYQRPGVATGSYVLYAGAQGDKVDAIVDLYGAELQRVTGPGPGQDEIMRARRQIVAEQEMQMQDNLELAMTCALDELYGLGYDHVFAIRRRMEAIDPETVRAAAASVLATNRMVVSILLPAPAAAP